MAVGKHVVGNIDGVGQISEIPRGRFAPDAIGGIFQGAPKFLYFERTDPSTRAFPAEFDMLRQKAEARVVTESGFPDEFVSLLCMQDAALTRREKTSVPATSGSTLAF